MKLISHEAAGLVARMHMSEATGWSWLFSLYKVAVFARNMLSLMQKLNSPCSKASTGLVAL